MYYPNLAMMKEPDIRLNGTKTVLNKMPQKKKAHITSHNERANTNAMLISGL